MFAASPLSLAAVGLYLLVFATTAYSAGVARGHRQQAWHIHAWALLAFLFIMLAVARWLAVEDLLRDSLREALRSEHSYGDRRAFQRPLAAGAIALAGLAAFWWVYHMARGVRGRRNVAVMVALASGIAMVMLVALRIVSLHPVDRLLYGALKLNWFADIGLSLLVVAAAYRYARIVRA